MKLLILSDEHVQGIRGAGEAAYPNECCGILYGIEDDQRRIVTAVEAVENVFDESERHHRFSIAPSVLMQAEKRSAERGELVLGFYHSHPDHPAVPSEFDRSYAWSFYSYVIVAVERGRSADMKSWQLNEHTRVFEPQTLGREGETI